MKKYISTLLLTILLFFGCEKQVKLHSIKLYQNGILTQEWTATSYPRVFMFGTKYQFREARTNKMITVQGNVVVEPLE